MRLTRLALVLVTCAALAGCSDSSSSGSADGGGGGGGDASSADAGGNACDAAPVIRTTSAGVKFVRTPDACFEALVDWPYAAKYVDIDGLRQAYVDEGPQAGPVVLLLHGQPSWSYLYRKMIPVLVKGGYRVIAMDHLGMGRSDKPTDIKSYSYLGHYDRLLRFIEKLDLRDINLFVQDWGSLIGLRVAGLNPDRFARIAVGNGILPVVPAGFKPFPEVKDPDKTEDVPAPFDAIPAQQVPFYDGCKRLLTPQANYFGVWMKYAMKSPKFRASLVLEAMTWFALSEDVKKGYDAPFPSRPYMAGARVFPSLANELGGQNAKAWEGLKAFKKPFLTLWAANDPGQQGTCEAQNNLIDSIAGAAIQPHARLDKASHFLQDDQGAEIGRRLAAFFASAPVKPFGKGSRYCELLLAKLGSGGLEAAVWGTQNLNDCPAADWNAIDTEAIKTATQSLAVIRNGPRTWIVDETTAPSSARTSARMTFGKLEMRLLATVKVAGSTPSQSPYTELTVERATTYTFKKGSEVYELTSPQNVTYVMQSMSNIIDDKLALADLPGLGARLKLPQGWTYSARTLTEDLVMKAGGTATVLQDDLSNTYQRR